MPFSHGRNAITDGKHATSVRYAPRPHRMIQQDEGIFIASVFFTPTAGSPAPGSWRPIQHLLTLPRINPEAKLATLCASTL